MIYAPVEFDYFGVFSPNTALAFDKSPLNFKLTEHRIFDSIPANTEEKIARFLTDRTKNDTIGLEKSDRKSNKLVVP